MDLAVLQIEYPMSKNLAYPVATPICLSSAPSPTMTIARVCDAPIEKLASPTNAIAFAGVFWFTVAINEMKTV
jgi:hypothetical protein